MNPSTNQLVLWVVTVYFVLLVAIGWLFSRHTGTSASYYKGGNVIPWWAVGLSQYMASFSAYSFVVIAGVIYSKGIFGLLWTLLAPLSLALGALLFARRWRRTGLTTPIEYFLVRFSPRFRQVFAWLGLISRPLGNGIRMAAFGILITALLGFDRNTLLVAGLSVPDAVVIGGVVVVIIYTLLGGLFGAVVADILQFVILQAALIPLFVISYLRVGGWDGLVRSVPAQFMQLPAVASPDWLWFIGWAVIFFCDYNAGQWGLITRYLGTRSERDAEKAGLLSAVLYLPLSLLALLPILAARALNPEIHPESSFGWISREVLPGGLVAAMVAAMFSATLSTISAELNTLAGVFAIDIYQARINPGAPEARVVVVGRLATFVAGAAMIAVGLLVLHGAGLVLNAAQQVASFFVIPMAVPMLLGLFTWRVDSRGAFAAMLAGAIAAAVFYYLPRNLGCTPGAIALWQNAGTAAVSVLVFYGSRLAFRADDARRAAARTLVESLAVPLTAPAAPEGGFPAPLKVVGLCVLFTALILLTTLIQPASRTQWPAIVATCGGLIALAVFALWADRCQRQKTDPLPS
jgi:Na+/proline symporter